MEPHAARVDEADLRRPDAVRTASDNLNPRWYTVDRIRVSSLSESWAVAWQTPTKRGEDEFQLVATDFKFDQTSLEMKAGSQVKVELRNQGQAEHNFTFTEADGSALELDLHGLDPRG